MKRLSSALLILVLFVLGCESPTTNVTPKSSAKDLTAFSFSSLSVTATLSGTEVSATVPFGTDLTALVATFSVSDKASASVGTTAQVSAKTPNDFTKPVTYTVVAEDGSKKTYVVTVSVAPSTTKSLTAFSFLSPAATGTITETAIAVTVPWGTDVTKLVATFTSTGDSTAVSGVAQTSGTTVNDFTSPVTYVVTAADGSTQSYTVTVTIAANTAVAATGVTVTPATLSLVAGGKTGTITASLVPANATNKAVAWSSSDPAIATVNAGVVTPLVKGKTTITATSADGSFTATCEVTVQPVPVTGVTVSPTTLSLTAGGLPETLTATVAPANAENKAVTWSSSDGKIATVSDTGAVTPVAAGEVTITATTVDGNATAFAKVTVVAAALNARFAQAHVSGSHSSFSAVTNDSSGNTYAVGYILGTGTHDFGNSVTVAGTANTFFYNPVIVKYSASGIAQWARSLTATRETSSAYFNAVTGDSAGNIYAVGYINGDGADTYNFGNSVSVTGIAKKTTLIVKYDSNGAAQWARTLTAGGDAAVFNGVSIDSSGNLYAVGSIKGSDTYDFGNAVSVSSGGKDSAFNVVIVKYDNSGVPQWAQTVLGPDSTKGESVFKATTVDSAGNIYAVGSITGTNRFNFGGSAIINSAGSWTSSVVVKYDTNGQALWAKASKIGEVIVNFNAVATDSSNNIYAVGSIKSTLSSDTMKCYFSDTVTTAPPTTASGENAVVVKYDSTGIAQWAKSATTSRIYEASSFNGVSIDANGDPYVVGMITGTGTYDFGNTITTKGTATQSKTYEASLRNTVIVKYQSTGVTQWAKSLVAGVGPAFFYGCTIDLSGNVYAAGAITGTASYDFGNSITAKGSATGDNAVLVRYAYH